MEKGHLLKKQNEKTKRKISESSKNRIWICNWKINKLINKNKKIPKGFFRGFLRKELLKSNKYS